MSVQAFFCALAKALYLYDSFEMRDQLWVLKYHNDKLLIYYLTNNLSNYFINDLVVNSKFNIIKNEIKTIDDVINYGKQIIEMKTNTYKELLSIKKFL